MKFSIFLTLLIVGFASHASFRSPKMIAFYPYQGTKFLLTFDRPIVFDEDEPSTPAAPDEPTHVCDIYYYNMEDKELRVNSHRNLVTDVKVNYNDKTFFVAAAFGSGRGSPFETKWNYVTTIVYKNSTDCHARKNPIRIQISLYHAAKPVYTNEAAYNVGWENGTDKAYFFTGRHSKEPEFGSNGTVTEWY